LKTLVEDIVHLQNALGITLSHIAGHDWGGAVSWELAATHPERTRKLIILNAPYLPAYRDMIRSHPIQLLKSGYIFFFQLPWLPEVMFRTRKYALIERTFRGVDPVWMDQNDIRKYKEACAQPGALRAMLGWYRANFWRGAKLEPRSPYHHLEISVPTCVIWGERDPFLDCRLNEPLDQYVPDFRIHYLPEGNHWVQMSLPNQVNSLMTEFFGVI
jgi:pimeloyl-ACP methyl ester carboxylesterase